MSLLYDFLQRNDISKAPLLPAVHTTPAYHLRKIIGSQALTPTSCDVFVGEKLNYFFVGRPAYKYPIQRDYEFWQLPVCFVVDFSSVRDVRRVFPFDSGGFAKRHLPEYLTVMDMKEFDVGGDADAVSKLIGTFFGTPRRYFRMQGKKETDIATEYELSPLDAEIMALHKLAIPTRNATFDDRQFAIELQSTATFTLEPQKVLAVIAPVTYFDDQNFLDQVENKWKATPLSYDIFPLNPEYYYMSVYEKMSMFLSSSGIL